MLSRFGYPALVVVMATLLLSAILAESAAQNKQPTVRERVGKYLSQAIRIGESKPVIVNHAQFVVVAQSEWNPPESDEYFPMIAPVELQMRITNLGKAEVR